MSSWTYTATFDISKLEELAAKAGGFSASLEDVASDIAEEVRNNIRQKNIIDTGDLLGSIESGLHSDEVAYVRDGVSYGVYNEFGTYKMAARPHLIPAAELFGRKISERFRELMR